MIRPPGWADGNTAGERKARSHNQRETKENAYHSS